MDFQFLFQPNYPSVDPLAAWRAQAGTPQPAAPAAPANAAKVNQLLKALGELLETISDEGDTSAAADGLHDLLDHSRLDLEDVLTSSRQAREALQALKQALSAAQEGGQHPEDSEKIKQVLQDLDDVYAEQIRRQNERDWDFLWNLIYLDERRRRQVNEQAQQPGEVNDIACSLPDGIDVTELLRDLPQAETQSALPHILALLSQRGDSSRTEKALLIHTGLSSVVSQVLQAADHGDWAQLAGHFETAESLADHLPSAPAQ